MEREMLGGLDDLASYERPKKIALIEEEFTIENGTLTPTQKVKRRVVQERFKHVIDALYEEENVERTVFAASELLPTRSA
jgi:long-chain acyl-CoA synthetase